MRLGGVKGPRSNNMPRAPRNVNPALHNSQLAFLTPPFLGGISAELCEISPAHNSDFL